MTTRNSRGGDLWPESEESQPWVPHAGHLIDVLAEAAIAMPWPGDQIESRLLHWCRSSVLGDISIQRLPAPPPDLTLVLFGGRFLVAKRSVADPPFTYRDEQMLVALVTMATTSHHAARREERLKRQAVTDDLTGLWHHGYFRELFEHAVETRVGETMGVLFADVDRFKQVNDEIGHLEADDVLREIGHRMRQTLPEDAIVARMGGDEFAALVRHLDDADHLERIVADLQEAVLAPMPVGDLMLSVGVSVGSALSVSGADDPEDLLREAERDMRRRKRSRRDGPSLRWYDEREALREMMDQGLVDVAFQPVVRLSDGQIVGYEALVRARHEELGTVAPLLLVDAASRLRLLDEVSEVVVGGALTAMHEVVARARTKVTLSINVEFEQLRRESRLLESLPRRVADAGVRLVLEVAERQVGRWTDEQRLVADELRAAGIGLAVDDFGVGYTDLGLLTSYPWTWVKVDRSLFVGTGESDRTLLTHVARMLADLDLTVVAKGLETAEQAALARGLGIDLAQGTWLAPPQPAAAVQAALSRHGLRVPHLKR
jgi:diguanylate cyclase (GGDEF)-like protein